MADGAVPPPPANQGPRMTIFSFCPFFFLLLSLRCANPTKSSSGMLTAASVRWQAARFGRASAAARPVPKRHCRIAAAAPKVAAASLEVGEGDSDSWFFTEVGQKTWCARDADVTFWG